MPIVRTQFKETVAKRNSIKGDIKLGKFKNSLSITDVRELKSTEVLDNKFIIFEYAFNVDYTLSEPKGKSIGEVKIVGEIVYADSSDKIDKILKEWKKNKNVEQDIAGLILNVAFSDAQIEALEQSKKVGLPPPVPLMRFKK